MARKAQSVQYCKICCLPVKKKAWVRRDQTGDPEELWDYFPFAGNVKTSYPLHLHHPGVLQLISAEDREKIPKAIEKIGEFNKERAKKERKGS